MLALINMIGQAMSIAGNASYKDPPYCKSPFPFPLHFPLHSPNPRFPSHHTTHHTYLFLSPSDRNGNIGALAMTVVEFLGTIFIYFYLRWRNQQKDKNAHMPEADEQRQISLDIIGERHP